MRGQEGSCDFLELRELRKSDDMGKICHYFPFAGNYVHPRMIENFVNSYSRFNGSKHPFDQILNEKAQFIEFLIFNNDIDYFDSDLIFSI